MASKTKNSQGTVLLRQAEPKYKFVGKKLPKQLDEVHHPEKESNNTYDLTSNMDSYSKDYTSIPVVPQSNQTNLKSKMFQHQNTDFTTISSQGNKPVAIVGASFKSTSSSPSVSKSPLSHSLNGSESTSFDSQPQFTQRLPNSGYEHNTPNSQSLRASMLTTPSTVQNQSSTTALMTSNTFEQAEPVETPLIDTSAAAVALSGVTHEMLHKCLVQAESERDRLKKDLDAQLQVNGELKRLLVASVGDDLSKRVERLAQDRVQMSMDIGGFSKKMTEDYENLDKMSIQADMWRSKYLASRVMVEELGNARAYFSLQWHESQEALQQILNERHELRTNLLEAYKILQQVKGAFDPLNSHRSTSLTSTNVLDLSRACQQLGEAVRYRLLPAHVGTPSSVELDMDSWADSVTRAEQYAHDLLSRPSEPTGSLQSGSSSVLPVPRSPTPPHVNRFHPHVKHENVTYHCCKCKGEIRVV